MEKAKVGFFRKAYSKNKKEKERRDLSLSSRVIPTLSVSLSCVEMATLNLTTVDLSLDEYLALVPEDTKMHAYLMIGAWSVVIPLATFVPLLCRGRKPTLWALVYLPLMLAGLGATGYALYLAYMEKQDQERSHLITTHAIVGAATVVLAGLLSLAGFCGCYRRAPKGSKGASRHEFWRATMLWLGRLCLVLGCAASALGFRSLMSDYGLNNPIRYIQIGVIAGFCLGAVLAACLGFYKGPDGSQWDNRSLIKSGKQKAEELRALFRFSKRRTPKRLSDVNRSFIKERNSSFAKYQEREQQRKGKWEPKSFVSLPQDNSNDRVDAIDAESDDKNVSRDEQPQGSYGRFDSWSAFFSASAAALKDLSQDDSMSSVSVASESTYSSGSMSRRQAGRNKPIPPRPSKYIQAALRRNANQEIQTTDPERDSTESSVSVDMSDVPPPPPPGLHDFD